MAKQKSIDYILGMFTGASIMLAAWDCTNGTHLIVYHPVSESCE